MRSATGNHDNGIGEEECAQFTRAGCHDSALINTLQLQPRRAVDRPNYRRGNTRLRRDPVCILCMYDASVESRRCDVIKQEH